MSKVFSKVDGGTIRNVIRAVLLCATAFGFDMTGNQVAGIMLVVEAILGAGTASPLGDVPPPQG